MDKMREEFEKYWLNTRGKLPIRYSRKGYANEYKSPVADCSWEFWKASRESLVVELPEKYSGPVNDFYGMGFDTGISRCKKAIHAAGVRTK